MPERRLGAIQLGPTVLSLGDPAKVVLEVAEMDEPLARVDGVDRSRWRK